MSKKNGRIAQDQLLASVEQAVALERQRIDSITEEQVDEVGGGIDIPSTTSPGSKPPYSEPTMGMYDASMFKSLAEIVSE